MDRHNNIILQVALHLQEHVTKFNIKIGFHVYHTKTQYG